MENESKHDRFVRIAEARTNKIIDMMRLLGNCSNTSNYEFSDAEVKQILDSIDKEFKQLKSRFAQSSDRKGRFTLGEGK